MITKSLIATLIIIAGAFVQPVNSDVNIERRILKRVTKIYDNEHVTINLLNQLPPDYQESESKIIKAYSLTSNQQLIGHVFYGITYACHFGGCAAPTSDKKNMGREEIKYLVYLDLNKKVKYLEIIDFESNYGYEIASNWWLKQFYNKRIGEFIFNQNIDGISGATVSCKAFVNTMNGLDSN